MSQEKKTFIINDIKLAGLALLALCFFVFGLNPTSLPVVFLLIIPVLVGLISLWSTRVLLVTFVDTSVRRAKLIGAAVALSLVMVFTLGSLGQLGVQDFVLTVLLAAGSCFYFYKYQESN